MVLELIIDLLELASEQLVKDEDLAFTTVFSNYFF